MSTCNYLPLVSVIILNWNGKDYLNRCVKSVLETNYPQNLVEIIVVDNGSTDGSVEFITQTFPQVKLIENKKNLGFCEGNNVGMKKASGDLVILLNNDTVVDSAWINEILKKAKDPRVGIVGCKLYFPGTKIIQVVGFKFKFEGYWETIGSGEEDNGQFDDITGLDYFSGASLVTKKEVIAKIGFLDPKFYSYSEDADFCYRASKAGYILAASNAIVYHYGSMSWDKLPLKKAYLHCRNRLYFVIKHYPPRSLLSYMLLPFRELDIDLHRFSRRATVLQRVKRSSENIDQTRTLTLGLKMLMLRTVFFFVSLPVVMLAKKNFADTCFSNTHPLA